MTSAVVPGSDPAAKPRSRKTVPAGAGVAIDLKSPDLYRHDRHLAAFSRLRRETPVYWNPESDSTGFWAVTKYDDAVAVLQDVETFSTAFEQGGIRIFNIADVSAELPAPHLFAMVPPMHTEMRRVLGQALTSDRVARLEGFIRATARALIGRFAGRGHADLPTEFASPLVAAVLTKLLGVPEADGPMLMRWSELITGDDDEDYQPSEAERRDCVGQIDRYASALLAERRRAPGHESAHDLASLLAVAVAGDRAEEALFAANLAALIMAGTETTRHSIANAIWAFSLFPEQKAKLVADTALLKNAIKEVLRWAPPLLHIRRTATRDVVLRGVQIRRGDKVVTWYASANRDEDKWADADQFRIDRFSEPGCTGHLGFGIGAHHCLGWRLAELQMRVALEELLSALSGLTAAGPIDRVRSNFIYGVKRLPVSFASRSAP
jgi:linalool 8-monooxygenase